MDHRTVRIGLIGTGRHGARYANHLLHDVPGLSLTAVCRRSPEGRTQAEEWGVRYFQNWSDLISDPEVDAVIAVTTPNLNLEITTFAANLGKPVLIEKPLAATLQQAEAMVDICAARNVPLTVGQTLRFNETILALRENLSMAGRLHSFHASQRLEKTLHGWLDDPSVAGAGVILHTAVHLFDALRFITGREVRRLKAIRFCRHNTRCEDLFVALLEFDDGLIGTVDASKVGPARIGRYEFVGEKGQLQGDQVHNLLEFVDGGAITSLPLPEVVSTIVPLLTAWRDMLQGHGPNPIPGEDGLAAVRIADACLRSADEDRWICLDKECQF